MNTSKDNVQLMIEAFTNFREGDDHSAKAFNSLLRILLDNSKIPFTQTYDHQEQRMRSTTDIPLTDEERTEIAAMNELINGGNIRSRAGEVQLWESHDDLMALLITYPPVILEQLLITGMIIYLLRADNIDIDSDTEDFNEFFAGWSSVVVNCHD